MDKVFKHRFLVAAFGFFSLGAASFASAVPMLQCNGCDAQGMESRADLEGPGFYCVYDAGANVIRYIHAKPINDQNTQFLNIELSVPANVLNDFAAFHAVYVQNGNSESFHLALHILIGGGYKNTSNQPTDDGNLNAFDTIKFSAANNMIINGLNNPLSLTGLNGFATSVLQIFKSSVVSMEGLHAIAVISFNDGSQRTYQWDPATQTYKAIPGTAKDAHLNSLPESHAPGGSDYLFTTGVGMGSSLYDQTNITNWFNMQAGAIAGSCSQLSFDGATLKCIHPN